MFPKHFLEQELDRSSRRAKFCSIRRNETQESKGTFLQDCFLPTRLIG